MGRVSTGLSLYHWRQKPFEISAAGQTHHRPLTAAECNILYCWFDLILYIVIICNFYENLVKQAFTIMAYQPMYYNSFWQACCSFALCCGITVPLHISNRIHSHNSIPTWAGTTWIQAGLHRDFQSSLWKACSFFLQRSEENCVSRQFRRRTEFQCHSAGRNGLQAGKKRLQGKQWYAIILIIE